MDDRNSRPLLADPEQKPDDALFRQILGIELYQIYSALLDILSESGLSAEWRYYSDGKSWLSKVTSKKKTIFWLSLWESCLKTGFYFTEKTRSGIMELEIDPGVKSSFLHAKQIGRLFPLILEIDHKDQLETFIKIVDYKISTVTRTERSMLYHKGNRKRCP